MCRYFVQPITLSDEFWPSRDQQNGHRTIVATARRIPTINVRRYPRPDGAMTLQCCARLKAGSDNACGQNLSTVGCNNDCKTGVSQRPSRSIWERDHDESLPPMRTAFRNSNNSGRRTATIEQQRSFRSRGTSCRNDCNSDVRLRRSQSMSHDRRDTYDRNVPTWPNCGGSRSGGNFTMSGTIWSDDSDVRGYPTGQQSRDLGCFQQSPLSDTCQETDVFAGADNDCNNNQQFRQQQFPAAPCCPCARTDYSSSTPAPPTTGWRNFSSSDPGQSTNDDSRDFRTFGQNDSYAASSPFDQTADRAGHPRSRSVDRAGVCSRRADFSYIRYIK